MALFSDFGKPENDPGKWFTYGTDGGDPVRARLRHVPQHILRRLRKRFGQDKLKMKAGGDTVIDTEKSRGYGRARAAYSLMETENWRVRIADDAGAVIWSDILDTPTEIGDLLLDGKWNETARDRFLGNQPEVVEWINDIADDEVQKREEDEEVAEKNS